MWTPTWIQTASFESWRTNRNVDADSRIIDWSKGECAVSRMKKVQHTPMQTL